MYQFWQYGHHDNIDSVYPETGNTFLFSEILSGLLFQDTVVLIVEIFNYNIYLANFEC